jgi:hypothetical protein
MLCPLHSVLYLAKLLVLPCALSWKVFSYMFSRHINMINLHGRSAVAILKLSVTRLTACEDFSMFSDRYHTWRSVGTPCLDSPM